MRITVNRRTSKGAPTTFADIGCVSIKLTDEQAGRLHAELTTALGREGATYADTRH